jgi:CheY-like chemotaxis protein
MSQERVVRKRILLADDQQGVRDAIKYLLKVDEHTVTEASNGREALDLYRRGEFDLVITDYTMPEMGGNELAVRIKRVAPAQRILMITAYSTEAGSKDNPVDAILSKPFSFHQLRVAIAALLV